MKTNNRPVKFPLNLTTLKIAILVVIATGLLTACVTTRKETGFSLVRGQFFLPARLNSRTMGTIFSLGTFTFVNFRVAKTELDPL